MIQRNQSLDALRGFAILAMVLSGSIAYGDTLPAWMYHAQVPPPEHRFIETIAGITWVDLVFPFFLFSMGAAIPLALKKYTEAGKGFLFIAWIALKRFLLLAFFALFTEHMKAWIISDHPTAWHHFISLVAFVLLFFQFYDNKSEKVKTLFIILKASSFLFAIFLLWKVSYGSGVAFDFYKSDIIIMVLANMAFFGTLIYYFTINRPLLRIGILPFIMAVFLAAKGPGNGWAKELFNFSYIGDLKFDWLYKFYFLKYLFIVIPGTIAGEWMLQQAEVKDPGVKKSDVKKQRENLLALLSIALVCLNLYGLFSRMLIINFAGTCLLCGVAVYATRNTERDNIYGKLVAAGTYLLLLGLFFEAYEGGIKKDHSTYSYYFVSSGLAFFSLVCFTVMAKRKYVSFLSEYFSLNGKNPMVAYVAGSLLLLPLMYLTNIKQFWDAMNQNAFMGFAKGLVFTGIVSLVTILFVKRRWFWKT